MAVAIVVIQTEGGGRVMANDGTYKYTYMYSMNSCIKWNIHEQTNAHCALCTLISTLISTFDFCINFRFSINVLEFFEHRSLHGGAKEAANESVGNRERYLRSWNCHICVSKMYGIHKAWKCAISNHMMKMMNEYRSQNKWLLFLVWIL